MSEAPQIVVDFSNGLLTITLHRPERLNAFTPQMLGEMLAALDRADDDDEVRAIIITGSGERAFCAGADLGQGTGSFDYATGSEWMDVGSSACANGTIDWSHPGVRDGGGRLSLRLFASRKPVIGAINGPAVGIGATMTLPMDLLVASEAARFGFVFSRLGIVPEAASSWFLPRRVGIATALEWCFSGRMVDAAEAREAKLVREVVPVDDLIRSARALAHNMIVGTAPVSIALTRALMWQMLGASDPMVAHRLDSRLMWERGASADAAEGVGAFLDKRAARFPDLVSQAMANLPPELDKLRW